MKHLEIRSFEFDNNVTVTVKFDYDKDEVSIVNRTGNGENFMPRNYVFSKRGPDKMTKWIEVLEALLTTVKGAREEMLQHIASRPKSDLGNS